MLPSFSTLKPRIKRLAPMYKMNMTGISLAEKAPMRLMPPKKIIKMKKVINEPEKSVGIRYSPSKGESKMAASWLA